MTYRIIGVRKDYNGNDTEEPIAMVNGRCMTQEAAIAAASALEEALEGIYLKVFIETEETKATYARFDTTGAKITS